MQRLLLELPELVDSFAERMIHGDKGTRTTGNRPNLPDPGGRVREVSRAVRSPVMRIAVYCGAHHGARPEYTTAARRLGESLSERGHDLVYGGGHVGLMGVVADAVLRGGREVTGVITEHLMKWEVGHDAVSELVVVPDMAARKRVMYEMADAYIALPGGVGTLEELFEVLCWRTLGLHPRPIGLLEVEGYWSHLVTFLDHAVDEGFLSHENRGLLLVDDDIEHLLDDLAAERTTPTL